MNQPERTTPSLKPVTVEIGLGDLTYLTHAALGLLDQCVELSGSADRYRGYAHRLRSLELRLRHLIDLVDGPAEGAQVPDADVALPGLAFILRRDQPCQGVKGASNAAEGLAVKAGVAELGKALGQVADDGAGSDRRDDPLGLVRLQSVLEKLFEAFGVQVQIHQTPWRLPDCGPAYEQA